MKKAVLFLSLCSLLGGCASSKKVDEMVDNDLITNEEYRKMLISEEKKLNERLVKSALLAAESQKILAETNNGLKRPHYDYDKIREARFQATYVPEGMDRILPIDWVGPVEPVLETLVTYAGYTIQYKGIKPVQSREVTLLPENNINIKQHIDNIDINSQGYIKDIIISEPDRHVVVVYENF